MTPEVDGQWALRISRKYCGSDNDTYAMSATRTPRSILNFVRVRSIASGRTLDTERRGPAAQRGGDALKVRSNSCFIHAWQNQYDSQKSNPRLLQQPYPTTQTPHENKPDLAQEQPEY